MKKLTKQLLSLLLTLTLLLPYNGILTVESFAADTDIIVYVTLTRGFEKDVSLKLSVANTSFLNIDDSNGVYEISMADLTGAEQESLFYWLMTDSLEQATVGQQLFYAELAYTKVFGLSSSVYIPNAGEYYFEYQVSCVYNGKLYKCQNHAITVSASAGGDYNEQKEIISSISDYNKSTPDGYNFDTDRWSFYNINETIEASYYTRMFGEQKGAEIYEKCENDKPHGHCYGMALSTATTLFNCPYVSEYITSVALPLPNLKSIEQDTLNADLSMTAKDYIKYSYTYQFSASTAAQLNSNSYNGIGNAYNAVRDAVYSYSDSTGIIITLFDSYVIGRPDIAGGNHAVYAVGIDGSDILVNDSNEPNTIGRIEIDGDTWSYTGGGWTWSNDRSSIGFVDDIFGAYLRLKHGVPVAGAVIIDADTEDSSIDYSQPIDTDKLLVVDENNSFTFSQSDDMLKIQSFDGGESDSTKGLYWLKSGYTVSAKNSTGEASEVKLVGNDLKITAHVPSEAEAEITITEDEESRLNISTQKDSEVTFSFVTLDENKEFVTATMTGTASGDKVTAAEGEQGVEVSGLTALTVTLETAGGEDSLNIKNADGENVSIIIDEDNSTVSALWDCEHDDSDHDGICDICAEDLTRDCSCMCHSLNKLVQFFYKLLRVFWKLFGVEDKHICPCGKAHW